MKIGQGFDVHALVRGRDLIVGGVKIPYERGLQGHSDADVLLHAICDAILGAAGLGDIGQHFPDSDARYGGIDSRKLLREVAKKVAELKLRIVNIDATIIAQEPRMAPYKALMIGNVASDLGITPAMVNIKATTTEGLGFLGRVEGIAAQAIVLLE
jgi:2-C-methyl-D-erythritol 2,4-cyclodiphosphate synthase